MKIFSLTSILSVAGATSSILLSGFNAFGQTTVATAPVGYLQTSCLSNSDTLVAPPFTRPAAFTGAVSSISSTSTTATITLGSASLTADAYDAPPTTSPPTPPTKDTYYLSIGPATATLTGTVSVTSGSTTVTGASTTFGTDVKVGDRITINDGVNLLTYTVTAIASTTSLTIDRAFSDTAATGSTSSVATASKATAAKTTTVKMTGRTATAMPTTAAITSAATLSGLAATYDHSPYEGRSYQVTTNGTSTVTVNLNGDTLSSVAAGTQVSIIPYWTLDSVFNTTAGENVSFTPTTSLFTLKTQVLIPDYTTSDINLSAAAIYFYYKNGSNVGWRKVGDSDLTVDHGYDPLLPDGYITVRTPASASTLPVTFAGSVPTNKLVTTLATNSVRPQDDAVALARPADTTLGSLGLNITDGSFVATTSFFTLKDQILVYNNNTAEPFKSASAIYFYYNNSPNVGWRKVGDPDLTTDHSADPIPAGSALTIRKATTSTGQTAIWTNSPNY